MKTLGALRRGLASLRTSSQDPQNAAEHDRVEAAAHKMYAMCVVPDRDCKHRTRQQLNQEEQAIALRLLLGERVYCHEFNDSSNDKKHDRRHPTINPIPEHVVPFDCDRARAGPRRAIDLM